MPAGPAGPCGPARPLRPSPVSPLGPCAPAGPVSPLGPCAPAGRPVCPDRPCAPAGPSGPGRTHGPGRPGRSRGPGRAGRSPRPSLVPGDNRVAAEALRRGGRVDLDVVEHAGRLAQAGLVAVARAAGVGEGDGAAAGGEHRDGGGDVNGTSYPGQFHGSSPSISRFAGMSGGPRTLMEILRLNCAVAHWAAALPVPSRALIFAAPPLSEWRPPRISRSPLAAFVLAAYVIRPVPGLRPAWRLMIALVRSGMPAGVRVSCGPAAFWEIRTSDDPERVRLAPLRSPFPGTAARAKPGCPLVGWTSGHPVSLVCALRGDLPPDPSRRAPGVCLVRLRHPSRSRALGGHGGL